MIWSALAGLVLVASLTYNVLQWRDAAVTDAVTIAEHAAAVRLAEEQGRRQAAEQYGRQSSELTRMAQADSRLLLAQIADTAADADARLRRYSDALALIPAADCAPGLDRQNAINELLSGASP